jgi:hypothetical protein
VLLRRRCAPASLPSAARIGWSFDKEHDHVVPPGWMKAEDEEREEPGEEM